MDRFGKVLIHEDQERLKSEQSTHNRMSRMSVRVISNFRSDMKQDPEVLSSVARQRGVKMLNKASKVEDAVKMACNHKEVRGLLAENAHHCECASEHRDQMINRKSSVMMETVRGKSQDGKSVRSADKFSLNNNNRFNRSPCRRSCSTIHNPMYHIPRFNLKITASGGVIPRSKSARPRD